MMTVIANNTATYLQCLHFLFQLDNMVLCLYSTLLDTAHNQTLSNGNGYITN